MKRCTSKFCIVNKNGIRGREFEPTESENPLTQVWCENCIKLANQTTFIAGATANMIRETYKSYIDTELPKDVKTFLEAYTREILDKLGAEL